MDHNQIHLGHHLKLCVSWKVSIWDLEIYVSKGPKGTPYTPEDSEVYICSGGRAHLEGKARSLLLDPAHRSQCGFHLLLPA